MAELEPAQKFQFGVPGQNTPASSEEMRNNYEALARTNYGTDGANPASPRSGMRRILDDGTGNVVYQWYDGATWRTMLQNIQGGVAAPAKQIVDITVAQTTWTIDHNLGTQPLVQVFDATWNQMQVVPSAPGAGEYLLVHSTANRVVITHTGPTAGHVIIIG